MALALSFSKLRDIEQRSTQKHSTIWNGVKAGTFPTPIKLGVNTTVWIDDEVNAVFAARMTGKSDDEVKQLVARLHATRERRLAAILSALGISAVDPDVEPIARHRRPRKVAQPRQAETEAA